MAPKLILTGFMATGKSAVGRAAAARLGWRLVDSDAELVARAGKPIPAIFAEHGEAQFRALEREVIAALADDPALCPQCGEPRPAVISTGGGALVDERNYLALKRAGVIICLIARPEVIAARVRTLSAQAAQAYRGRQAARSANHRTDGRAARRLRARRFHRGHFRPFGRPVGRARAGNLRPAREKRPSERPSMRTFRVELGPDAHPVHVGAGVLDQIGRLAREAGLTAGRALIVTDSNVARLYGERAAASLAAVGFAPRIT